MAAVRGCVAWMAGRTHGSREIRLDGHGDAEGRWVSRDRGRLWPRGELEGFTDLDEEGEVKATKDGEKK